MLDLSDTICALSTAQGKAGIAVVRLSGPDSLEAACRIFRCRKGHGEVASREALLGELVDDPGGAVLDECLMTYFRAPNSYTGEDVVELSLHGSPVIVARVLELLSLRGIRLARPGEFTMRGFLRGRMDLAQAEAVRDVIEASTLYQVQVAGRQRAGELSRGLAEVKARLMDVIVNLESAVEFVDENLSHDSAEEVAGQLGIIEAELDRWISSYCSGRVIRDGFSLAIVGRPNVGKSSLFNALLRRERSIVTEIPGTTRDVVSEHTAIAGIPVRLADTAGLRAATDGIERLGVERSWRSVVDADAVLLVVDYSQGAAAEDQELREKLSGLSCILVLNKIDLAAAWDGDDARNYAGSWVAVAVSARTGEGLERLQEAIMSHLLGERAAERDGILVTSLRHRQALEAARNSLRRSRSALRQRFSEEYVLMDLRRSLDELGAITGETTTEDLLGEIFSKFCIGK